MTSYNSSDFFNLAAFKIPPSRNFTYAFVSGSSYTIPSIILVNEFVVSNNSLALTPLTKRPFASKIIDCTGKW